MYEGKGCPDSSPARKYMEKNKEGKKERKMKKKIRINHFSLFEISMPVPIPNHVNDVRQGIYMLTFTWPWN